MTTPARLDALRRSAIEQGLLPPDAQLPPQDTRPWPAVLLMALGAWFAALPLLGVLGMLFGSMLNGAAGPYFVGALLLAGALVVLRSRAVPLFVEQLALPPLLLGLLSFGYVFFRDLPHGLAGVLMALLVLALGWLLPRDWLRVPLGATGAVLAALALAPHGGDFWRGNAMLRYGLFWQAGVLLWLAALAVQRGLWAGAAQARAAATLEGLAAGWLLACLVGLCAWAGSSFLVGGVLGGTLVGEVAGLVNEHQQGLLGRVPLLQGLSVALALGALLTLRRAWPVLRQPWLLAAALVPVALAAFMPALGALLLALAACAGSARWRLAAAAGVAVAWVIGAFYYQLAWPLAQKALVLAAAGALLIGLAWWPLRRAHRPTHEAATPLRPAWLGIGAAALGVVLVANVGIWQKEKLIAGGQPVFVELAPMDPRSLMQGDFMRLNFRLVPEASTLGLMTTPRPRVVARRDEQGIATVLRLHAAGTPLAADELLIELTPKDGRWTLVSDAWFFREGEAARWAAARYGEFRVAPDGRALLVNLRGEGLRPL